ncbi:MAG: bifunctional 2-polyprenyl-6-hydroxyphenol methylase/3-demethylubiquinol 3-O-methyltransferase UbiG, partial [Gammaproteobacteria bacterium]|nr:bifunctional 2-polyprenyl-6-hydroxyphenol methylase/3-demethylubiquinol 3-O-methyltransferase UbiG [Gammaproteobacteria bacterium]
PQEIAKFEELASRWWDPGSEFKPLHDINPLRLDYIDNCAELVDKKVLDVGCGGGILAESMALRGAQVTGIDMGSTPLSVARMHLHESGADVDYRQITAEDMAKEQAGSFDIITCMEMLEHVPDPSSIVQACSQLIKPGGHVFFSTLNRNPKSYLLAVLGAEYLLNLLPKGTHDYQKFIRPSELEAWSRKAGLSFNEIVGMTYNPFTRTYRISEDTDVNYIVHAQRSS